MNFITFTRINAVTKKIVWKQKTKKLYYKKLRLTNDYQYESEEEEQQTSKKPDKNKLPKNQQRMIW